MPSETQLEGDRTPTAGAEPVRRGGRRPIDRSPGFNAGDEDSVAERSRILEREAILRDRDLRYLASIPAFQRFIGRILDDSEALTRSWDTSKRRLIQEGRAMLAMQILNELKSARPDILVRIMNQRLTEPEESK